MATVCRRCSRNRPFPHFGSVWSAQGRQRRPTHLVYGRRSGEAGSSRDLTDEGWLQLWQAVGERLAAERTADRGHLLTEDVVRYQTVLALGDLGVVPGRLTAEYLSPYLRGGKVDLIVDAPSGAAIEFKYPRDSSTGISPDTMTFGELLKDVIRLPGVGAADAWVVQVLNPRLARYLRAAAARLTLTWPVTVGEQVVITGEVLGKLPLTAARALGGHTLTDAVHLECRCAHTVDDGLILFAHHVTTAPSPLADALTSPGLPTPSSFPLPTPGSPSPGPISPTASTRDGARREILVAVRALLARPGVTDVSVPEVIEEMHRRGTGYADSTIRTMMTAHLCAQATGFGVAGYDDLTRTERGRYRPQDPKTAT